VGDLSWPQALTWRMRRHHLVEPAGDLVRAAADIGGLHAQVMSSAELSLWARVDGLRRADVARALWEDRSLVKLWAARGTLYLLPSARLGTWLAALSTQTKFGNAGNAAIDELVDAIGKALDGRVLTRQELATEVARISGSDEYGEWVRSSWGSYLKAASFRGRICFADNEGKNIRFTTPDSWLAGAVDDVDPSDALREITRWFLAAYAPATPEDLARWWLGPPAPTRGAKMIAALGDDAVEVDVDGRRAWVLSADLPELLATEPQNVARLLPAFDPWVIGSGRYAPLLDPAHAGRVFRPQGWISPVVLVNGTITGVWKHERDGSVRVEPFGRLPKWAGTEIGEWSASLAEFLAQRL
jgi:uncharacterized protein YcaQ